jgi:hypothetical protein
MGEFVWIVCCRLKKSPYHSNLLDKLISTWTLLYSSDQSFLIEAVEQMNVNPQLNASLVKSLQQLVGKVQSQVGNNVHALLFMETKLLSWYSTRNSINLGSEDLLFILLLCQKSWRREGLSRYRSYWRKSASSASRSKTFSSSSEATESAGGRFSGSSSENGSTGFHSSHEDLFESVEDASGEWDVVDEPLSSGKNKTQKTLITLKCTFVKLSSNCSNSWFVTSLWDDIDTIIKYLILLKSDRDTYVPQVVHIGMAQDGLYFVLISEVSLLLNF